MRRASKVGLVAVCVAVVGVGLAVASWVRASDPGTQVTVGCYEAASLDADVTIVGLEGLDPVERCEDVYYEGVQWTEHPGELTACLNPQGAIAVMPGDAGICAELGIEPAPEPRPS